MLKAVAPTICRAAYDRRADDRARRVTVTADTVLIERQVDGVKMRVLVPVSAYAGLALARRAAPAADYAIVLSHRDSDLCVEVDTAPDLDALRTRLAGWSRVFGKPTPHDLWRTTATAFAPTRPAGHGERRPRFLARRKPGVPARTAIVFREDEIISYE